MMTEDRGSPLPRSAWDYAKLALELVALIVVLVVARIYGTHYLQGDDFQRFIAGLGALAPLAFVGVSTIIVMTPIPMILAIVPGTLAFGASIGASYALVGMTLGACAAFLIGRYLLGDVATRMKQKNFFQRRLKRADELLDHQGFFGVIALRLTFFNSVMLNYLAGTTAVALHHFFLGSMIGFMPKTFIIAYVFGSIASTTLPGSSSFLVNLLLLALLPSTRVCGVIALGLIARRSSKESA
jgi:uncharacterized membrane protein YdjX (TVP38/TMEM64 family)